MVREEKVKPIKEKWVLQAVQNQLLTNSVMGRRNYTIFQTGKATLLRVSDVLRLKKSDVYDFNGHVKKNAYIIDKKTKKRNVLYLRPVEKDLEDYFVWLRDYEAKHPKQRLFTSEWLFPSLTRPQKHIDERRFYMVMHDVQDNLHIDYLGTHTMRKTGAYLVYEQTNHDIDLVMKLLNHSSEAMTLAYLGLDREAREHILDRIDFN